MSKHTPGPWTAIRDDVGEGDWYILTDDEEAIATGLSAPDAHLIAAAPDLLAACNGLVGAYHDSIHGVASFSQATKLAAAMDAARVALAKAEGNL